MPFNVTNMFSSSLALIDPFNSKDLPEWKVNLTKFQIKLSGMEWVVFALEVISR